MRRGAPQGHRYLLALDSCDDPEVKGKMKVSMYISTKSQTFSAPVPGAFTFTSTYQA